LIFQTSNVAKFPGGSASTNLDILAFSQDHCSFPGMKRATPIASTASPADVTPTPHGATGGMQVPLVPSAHDLHWLLAMMQKNNTYN
jgi:hypothetical protein